jgi:hypothetical protein
MLSARAWSQRIAIVLTGGRTLRAAFRFGASSLDIVMFSAVAGVFVLTGLAACLVPAMRAGVINPREGLQGRIIRGSGAHR